MEFFYPRKQFLRGMGFLPFASGGLVGFGHGRVGVNGPQDFVQSQSMLHGQHILSEEVAGVTADDGRPEQLVAAGFSQNLDPAMVFGIGNGAIEVVNPIAGHLVRYARCFGFIFGQADPGNFGVGKGCPWDNTVVNLE